MMPSQQFSDLEYNSPRVLSTMPTYVYETIPEKEGEEPTQFEVFQKMSDDALTKHPETGKPVQRIISGGLPLPTASKSSGCCQSKCSCG